MLFHTETYHDQIVNDSKLGKGGDGGEQCRFAQGGIFLNRIHDEISAFGSRIIQTINIVK